ncbi:MAG: hypothetical protein V4580_07755 [Bacteroidota bacterium]
MKLKSVYVFFIIMLSFFTKAQSSKDSSPVLANSGSFASDSLNRKNQNSQPKLSMQDSKSASQGHPAHPANLKDSELIETKPVKIDVDPKK